ncbi:MAG: hypothetical protein QOG04_2161 [Actinomycetota bacterium]|nr:hypothetical protein [Actinomycetota bacterium]
MCKMDQVNLVRVELYRWFVEESRAPSTDDLASALDLPIPDVETSLRELAATDVIAFRPGTEDIWLVHPFCATDAPFTVTAADKRWDAICIWDALGILALVESDGEVTTVCPDCSDPLAIAIAGGRVVAPAGALVHFGVPTARWYEDIGYT